MPMGVICKTPAAVYKSTHLEPAPTEFDVPIGRSAPTPNAASGLSAPSAQASRNLAEGVINAPVASAPRINGPRPVREPAQVARIWIAPWIDKNDNLHLATIHYTEVRPRTWTVGKPEVLSAAGYVVPHQVLQAAADGQTAGPKGSSPAARTNVGMPLPPAGAGVVRSGNMAPEADDLPPPPN